VLDSRRTPLAKSAGIEDFDFRAMRSTASTLFQTHGAVKETQGQMRHADPATTLRCYVKVIPENQRKAVAGFARTLRGRGLGGGTESVTEKG
jgi:integrase